MSTRADDLNELERLATEVSRLRKDAEMWENEAERLSEGWTTERAALAKLREDLATECNEHEQTRAELARWREALGGDFGPQTPDAVPVFQREAERVQGQVAACEIAKARARVAELEQKNERLGRAKDGFASRAYDAESALVSARDLLETASEPYDVAQWTRDRDAWLSAHPTTGAEKVAIRK